MNESKDNDQAEDPGSRDRLRQLMKQAGEKLFEALIEVNKLRQTEKRRLEYRYADAYLGIAVQQVELARIVMRRRKKVERKVEVPSGIVQPAEPANAND